MQITVDINERKIVDSLSENGATIFDYDKMQDFATLFVEEIFNHYYERYMDEVGALTLIKAVGIETE